MSLGITLKRPPIPLLAVLALAAFLLVTTGFATSEAQQKQEPRRAALIQQILRERRDVNDLDQAVAELRSQVDDAQRLAGNSPVAQSAQLRDALAVRAGTTALSGPAVIVRVSDAPKDDSTPSARTTSFGTDRVQDRDIQLIVNALFASGAEGVAINDNRVSAVTPIRAAGGIIVVNYRPVTSPYRIVGIRADKRAFDQSQVARNFDQWKTDFQLGYRVQESKKAEIPAYSGRVSIDIAQPDSQK